MNVHHASPTLLCEALRVGAWRARLPATAAAFVTAWHVDDVRGVHEVAASLLAATESARNASREVSPGDHDRWAAVCLAFTARDALEALRPYAATCDVLAGAFADAAAVQLRGIPPTRRHGSAGRSLKAGREALQNAHREERGLRGVFERALAVAASDALAPLAMDVADAPQRMRSLVARADADARAQHDREQRFITPSLLRTRAVLALAHLAAALAEATRTASNADEARWLATMTLQMLRTMRTPGDLFPDAHAPETLEPAHDEPRADVMETTMTTTKTTPNPILETLQVDATDAAWRTAGSQLVKLTRDPVAALLCRHLGPDDPALRARVATFLQTELGAAMVSALLSAGITALPMAGPVPERLSRELRVRAMAEVGDVLADVLMGPLREVASTYLRDLPSSEATSRPVLDARTPAFGVVTSDVAEATRRA